MRGLISRYRWTIVVAGSVFLAALSLWLLLARNLAGYSLLLRLYQDKEFLKRTLREWGILAPVIFMIIQALQVIISPIPGEATGFLGGYLFGVWLGFIYSTIGLAAGSVAAFGVGRWLGARFVRNLVSKAMWDRLGFIVEAEGAILCFIIYLIPGLPKDMVSYLFGISPMPMWVFAVVSGLGRMPGTWVLSAQGSQTAAGQYVQVVLISAIAVAVALPLYYYRHRIVEWFGSRKGQGSGKP